MHSWFIIGCLVAGTTIGVVNYWLVNVVLLKKLRRISAVANAISNKDITFQCGIESQDVVGEIVDSFNRMAMTLREMIERLNAITGQLIRSSQSLTAITQDSAMQVQSQQSKTQNVVSAIGEMTNLLALNAAIEAGGALQAIAGAVSNIYPMNSQIAAAAASDLQLSVSQQVSHNIHNIEELTNESASTSQQITQAGGELAELAGQIEQMVREYKI